VFQLSKGSFPVLRSRRSLAQVAPKQLWVEPQRLEDLEHVHDVGQNDSGLVALITELGERLGRLVIRQAQQTQHQMLGIDEAAVCSGSFRGRQIPGE